MKGDPGCPECNGRGGRIRHGRFVVCICVRVTAAKLQAQRKMYESAGHTYKSVLERDREQREGR